MQAENIVLTKSQNKKHGGDYWYSRPGAIRFTQAHILKKLREGVEIDFHNGFEELELLGVLALAEKGVSSNTKINFDKKGDTFLMNRIIRNGGFIAYIEKLENQNGN